MMRQAGRYLPSYRKIREAHSFWEMVTTPRLAAEVSLLPLDVLSVDAVIFFSDILTLPYGLGIPVEMKESIGPVIPNPLRTLGDFEAFREYEPVKHTAFVNEALGLIRKTLPADKTLIGFAGAPWTVACYLVEGRGKKSFDAVKEWMERDPRTLAASLRELSAATVRYLKSQVDSGAHLVQVFDTWLADMPPAFFSNYYAEILSDLFREVQATGVPLIYFAKGSTKHLSQIGQLKMNVLSVDHGVDMREVDRELGGRFSLQGNLDPDILLHGTVADVRRETRLLVERARTLAKPPILNLGHGILPKTPVENAKAFVDEATQAWI